MTIITITSKQNMVIMLRCYFTDPDSLVYETETDDAYEDFYKDFHKSKFKF